MRHKDISEIQACERLDIWGYSAATGDMERAAEEASGCADAAEADMAALTACLAGHPRSEVQAAMIAFVRAQHNALLQAKVCGTTDTIFSCVYGQHLSVTSHLETLPFAAAGCQQPRRPAADTMHGNGRGQCGYSHASGRPTNMGRP